MCPLKDELHALAQKVQEEKKRRDLPQIVKSIYDKCRSEARLFASLGRDNTSVSVLYYDKKKIEHTVNGGYGCFPVKVDNSTIDSDFVLAQTAADEVIKLLKQEGLKAEKSASHYKHDHNGLEGDSWKDEFRVTINISW